jgi:hypothetical protein
VQTLQKIKNKILETTEMNALMKTVGKTRLDTLETRTPARRRMGK